MKNKNKALLLALCAALLVAATVLTTIAWLTSTGTVTNTFTVGKVEIELWEAMTDSLGEYYLITSGDSTNSFEADENRNFYDATKVKGNTYTLRPGHTYKKDVYIELKDGSEPCYLFVKVENGFAGSETDVVGASIEEQMYANGWLPVEGHKDVWALHFEMDPPAVIPTTKDAFINAYKSDNVRLKFEYKQGATFGNTVAVFDSLTLSGSADVGALKDKTITITAYAVQADGFDAQDTSYNAVGAPVYTDTMTDKKVWETAFPTEAGVTEVTDETTNPTPAPTT